MYSKKIVGIDWTPTAERPSIIPLRPSAFVGSRRRHAATNPSQDEATGTLLTVETPGKPHLNRLPRYDSKTRRFEFSVFLGLGVIALALIGPAIRDSGRFAEHRDAIVDALTTAPVAPAVLAGSPTNHAATNLSVVPAAACCDRAS